jgi:hypothetical protein
MWTFLSTVDRKVHMVYNIFMNYIFGPKLKEFREKKFPGESLRKVSEGLELGSNFYSYLSKIELSVSLPSEDFLEKIKKAYILSQTEYNELLDAYFHDKINQGLENLTIETESAPPAIRHFLRTVKKKNNESDFT